MNIDDTLQIFPWQIVTPHHHHVRFSSVRPYPFRIARGPKSEFEQDQDLPKKNSKCVAAAEDVKEASTRTSTGEEGCAEGWKVVGVTFKIEFSPYQTLCASTELIKLLSVLNCSLAGFGLIKRNLACHRVESTESQLEGMKKKWKRRRRTLNRSGNG